MISSFGTRFDSDLIQGAFFQIIALTSVSHKRMLIPKTSLTRPTGVSGLARFDENLTQAP